MPHCSWSKAKLLHFETLKGSDLFPEEEPLPLIWTDSGSRSLSRLREDAAWNGENIKGRGARHGVGRADILSLVIRQEVVWGSRLGAGAAGNHAVTDLLAERSLVWDGRDADGREDEGK